METVQCPHCSAPLSSPDEVCKKCFSEKNFTQRIRRIFRVYLPGAFLFSLLLACLGIVARNYIYASYQPAQCTIQSKGVLTVYLNKIDHYEPSLTYSVRTPDGSQEIVTGYKGPYFDGWNDRYLFAEDAEKVLQPYKIGATYACWYTSLRSPHAILVYANYPSGSTSLAFWLTLLMESLISGMFILVLSAIAELSALAFRGISTQGELISLERLTIDTQTRTIPTFKFKSRTDPPMNYQTTGHFGSIYLKIGTKVPIIYDPKNPAGNAYAGSRLALLILPIVLSILDLLILGFVFLFVYLFWLM